MTELLGVQLLRSRMLGFLGPGPVEDHVRRAVAFSTALSSSPARALDLGAGGGLPGLVLAVTTWPETSWCFVDAQAKRTAFLAEAVEELGLTDRVSVVTGRAEEVGRAEEHRGNYDLVVARSFATPGVTAECAAPLLRVGGHLLVSEPPASDPEARWPSPALAQLGLGPAELVVVDPGEDETHLARLELLAPVPDRYPRRVGIPAKRPLF